jgi:hypothetical protein
MAREMFARSSITVNITIACTLPRYISLNAIVAQSKNCYFGVNTMMELQNITATFDNCDILRDIFQLTSVPVLSDEALIFCSSIVQLTQNSNSGIVPLLHSVSDMTLAAEGLYQQNCNSEIGLCEYNRKPLPFFKYQQRT